MKHTISTITLFEISRGFNARFFHTGSMTIAYVEVDEGAELPEHTHLHEQVTTLLEGWFDLIVGGPKQALEPGYVCVIPSNVPHSGKAHTRCRIMDLFNPVREDFRKGEVAYGVR
ncbi:MAG: cupin domain-containing protein [Saprospiraceae bacterium]|nr:cupin domain-containing protein [Saprospiraceae bacterium]